MTNRLRGAAKNDLDTAIAVASVPKASAGGVGLGIGIPGRRGSRLLVNRHGQVTAAGAYYFDQVWERGS